MAFAEDSAIGVNHGNSEDAAIFKFQVQGNVDPPVRIRVRIEFDGAFNTVKAGNRESGAFGHTLKPPDTISNLTQHRAIQYQFAGA